MADPKNSDRQRGLEWEETQNNLDAAALERGKNYLLLIGIDKYKYVGRLSNAVKDAQDLKEILLKKYQFEQAWALELFDEKATYAAIDQSLRLLADQLTRQDSLIIYFGGHGHYDEFYEEGYWLPVEAHFEKTTEYFPYTNLIRAIRKIQSRHTFVIADSCYSGAVLVEGTRDKGSPDPREKDPSRWILASGRNEVVPDGVAGGNSPFAEQLLDTLNRYAGDGIPVLSLVDKVTTSVIHNGKQKPIGRPLHNTGDKGGQFIFHPKHNELLDWEEAEKKNTLAAYRLYLNIYPIGKFAEEAEYGIACLRDTAGAYDEFLEKFPDGKKAREAEKKLRAVDIRDEWQKAERLNKLSSYRDFLRKYPNSSYAEEARKRRTALRKAEEEPQSWATAKQAHSLSAYQKYLEEYPDGLHAKEAQKFRKRLERESNKKSFKEKKEEPKAQTATSSSTAQQAPIWKKPGVLAALGIGFLFLVVYLIWLRGPDHEDLMSQAQNLETQGMRTEAIEKLKEARNLKYTEEGQASILRLGREVDSIQKVELAQMSYQDSVRVADSLAQAKHLADSLELAQASAKKEEAYTKAFADGESWIKKGNWERAKTAFEKANSILPKPEVKSKISYCETQIKEEKYEELLNKAIKTKSLSSKLSLLKQAKGYKNTSTVRNLISQAEKEQKAEQLAAEKESKKNDPPPTDQIPRPQLKKIAGGTFQMGSNNGQDDEKPVHDVTVSDFYIGVYEVTNEEYCAFLNQKNPNVSDLKKWINLDRNSCRINKKGNGYVVESGYEKHPVVYVSWNGAQAYCSWGGYRLPTEAEWEYAAGGGSSGRTIYAGTSSSSSLSSYAVYSQSGTSRKGSKRANKLGLFDMSGNVWEWCSDDKRTYTSSPQSNPKGTGSGRVSRGGGWGSYASFCRVAFRSGWSPSVQYFNLGFRVARTP